jgi:hypothetical protein
MDSPIVFTDLKPDNLCAIKLLLVGVLPKYIIVGDGNLNIKKARMEKYLELMNYPQVDVLKGQANVSNDYPIDGMDLFTEEELVDIRNKPTSEIDIVNTNMLITDFVSDDTWGSKNVICMKEPTELLEIYKLDKNVFKKCNLYANDSMKLNGLMDRYDSSLLSEFINNGFKTVYYYDTFNTIGTNNLEIKNKRQFLNQMPDYIKNCTKCWYRWNVSVHLSIMETIADNKHTVTQDVDIFTRACAISLLDKSDHIKQYIQSVKKFRKNEKIYSIKDKMTFEKKNMNIVKEILFDDYLKFTLSGPGLIHALLKDYEMNSYAYCGTVNVNQQYEHIMITNGSNQSLIVYKSKDMAERHKISEKQNDFYQRII